MENGGKSILAHHAYSSLYTLVIGLAISLPIQRPYSAAPPGFRFGGGHFRVGGGLHLPDAGEFSKIFKNFLKKIEIMRYFCIFFKRI